MAWTATVRVLEAEVERLNADLDHEAREHQVTHERWMEAKDEVERLREALIGLLPFARGNQVVLDRIHNALDGDES